MIIPPSASSPTAAEALRPTSERSSGVIFDKLENILADAGDLIESRRPELVAQARAALRHFADEAPRQAE